MKLTLWIGTALTAVGIAFGHAGSASAQSDRTMGIDCTVAGHRHCGENGPIYGSRLYNWYGWHHRHRRAD